MITSGKKKLVLSGGGVKGIAMLGKLKKLFETDPKLYDSLDTIAGSSVGSLIGSLLLIGYTPKELFEFILTLDFKNLTQTELGNFLNKYGFNDGSAVMMVIKKLFLQKEIKENITFKELYEKTKKKLIITVTCINSKTTEYLSVDTACDMEVIMAIRMSISIPGYFTPIKYNGCHYIDGSASDNYPMQPFSSNLDEVIGIYLSEMYETISVINNIEDFLVHTFKSLMKGVNGGSLRGFERYTINIDVHEINIMNLNIDYNKKMELFNLGYNT